MDRPQTVVPGVATGSAGAPDGESRTVAATFGQPGSVQRDPALPARTTGFGGDPGPEQSPAEPAGNWLG